MSKTKKRGEKLKWVFGFENVEVKARDLDEACEIAASTLGWLALIVDRIVKVDSGQARPPHHVPTPIEYARYHDRRYRDMR